MTDDRKKAHIELALRSHAGFSTPDARFNYEPLLSPHPDGFSSLVTPFMGRSLGLPLWVSSMTGGTPLAGEINRTLATVCREFGMGMGLGSCRPLLADDTWLEHFALREVIGPDLPLYANLGINQVETVARSGDWHLLTSLVNKLEADGLIVHINPMQEFFQPEGDRLRSSPVETIKRLLEALPDMKLIVKEVGQGMGPESLRQLLALPLEAVEFGAYGGTNFSKLESLRHSDNRVESLLPLATVGHDSLDMVQNINSICSETRVATRHLIISGGVRDFLDGFYLVSKSRLPAVYGQASAMLIHAREGVESLRSFVSTQAEGLAMARSYLKIK